MNYDMNGQKTMLHVTINNQPPIALNGSVRLPINQLRVSYYYAQATGNKRTQKRVRKQLEALLYERKI